MDQTRISFGSKTFFVVFAALVILSVASSYYRYIVLEDYEIFYQTDDEGRLINLEE